MPSRLASLPAWIAALAFAAPLHAVDILGPEPFDTVPPAGWTQFDVGMQGMLWAADNSRPSPQSGGNAAFFDDFNTASNNDVWLISPAMDFDTAVAPTLDYLENVNFGFAANTHEVLMSSDYAGGDPTGATWTTLNAGIGAEDAWTPHSIDVSAFAGQASVHLAFRYVGDFDSEWWIDDVLVVEPDPYDVEVMAPADSDHAIGTMRDYTFRVTNRGTNSDTFDLVGGGTFFSSLSTMTTGMLAPDAFEDVTVTADVPCPAPVGVPETLSLTATSQGGMGVMATEGMDVTPVGGNSGGGTMPEGGYFFANSLAICEMSFPAFDWIDISGTGTDVLSSLDDDNYIGPFPIGFTFTYFGNDYTQFYINSNGWIGFDAVDPGGAPSRNNTALPTAGVPNDLIAGFWDDMNPDDLDPGGTSVLHGNGPGGELVVSFVRLPRFGADVDGWITFQIVLFPSGNIKIQFQDHGPSLNLSSSTVGLESSDGSQGLQYHFDGSGPPLFSSPLAVVFGLDPNSVPVELEAFSVE